MGIMLRKLSRADTLGRDRQGLRDYGFGSRMWELSPVVDAHAGVGSDAVLDTGTSAGHDPVTVDLAAAALMGLNYKKIPIIREALTRDRPLNPGVQPEQVELATNRPEWHDLMRGGESPFRFEPSDGWKGHIERD